LRRLLLNIFFLIGSFSVFSYENQSSCEECYANWFKGGPLSFSGMSLKRGTFKIKNYMLVEHVNHFYDSTWLPVPIRGRIGFTEVFDLRLGISDRVDFTMVLREQSQFVNHQASYRLGDSKIRLGIQLSKPHETLNHIFYRLLLEQTFPTGHFKNLNPTQKDLEVSGLGYYRTGAVLAAETLRHMDQRLIRTRLSAGYGFSPPSCLLTNYSLYGGAPGLQGKTGSIHDAFTTFGLEYTLTQHVCLVSDFEYSFSSKGIFHQTKGALVNQTPFFIERPQFQLLTIAPGLQINFSYNLGFNLCAWFSAAGKNLPSFQSAIFEFVIRN